MNRRVILGIVSWLVVGGAATTAGIAAIDVLEDGITGKNVRPLDDDAVHRALSRAGVTRTPSAPVPSPAASTAAGVTRNLAARGGGTVTARCEGGKVTILAATPAQGFHTDGFDRGPATSSSLTFESAEEEFAVTVDCQGGSPAVHVAQDDGHRGRHGGRGRG
ncbi:hypothetical protein GCM10027176_61500 [Actinoallomurus bryophytorum]|uniref:Uncharacterized protein n=1 Tax=Actinoallomurus bryophytorum TaxID=1490222 RepID=A0A543CPN8_9ACTN|nr:hypothetical protein [Actinoallomurus bryophytorum]TQL98940.1 hypothetical protein FB559_4593 [Actinoallomurus bryophytorum]